MERNELDIHRVYDYEDARKYCAEQGLHFLEDWIDYADSGFAFVSMTQDQVNYAMRMHIEAVRKLFTPQGYSFKERCGMALHFLFGKAR